MLLVTNRNTQIELLGALQGCFQLFAIQLKCKKIILALTSSTCTAISFSVNHISHPYPSVCQVCLNFTWHSVKFCKVQLSKLDVTLSDAGQNSLSVEVKFTPLEWSPALYSWQRRGFPAELHSFCVNNQGLTCGVKPCNWSDTSKGRLPPSLGSKNAAWSKQDRRERGGRTHTHTHIHIWGRRGR